MSLETNLQDVLDNLLRVAAEKDFNSADIIRCLDLTLLAKDIDLDSILSLQNKANDNMVAAVCTFSQYLNDLTLGDKIQKATVLNFPLGRDDLLISLGDLDYALSQGAQEIDYVFPYENYLSADSRKALNYTDVLIQACKKNHVTSKIIIESGAFSSMIDIYKLSRELIELGCDFIKTSTGTIQIGATLPSVFAIASAIKDSGQSCGIKVSGGVKTAIQAKQYAQLIELVLSKAINPEWFRIGASSLLDDLRSNALTSP